MAYRRHRASSIARSANRACFIGATFILFPRLLLYHGCLFDTHLPNLLKPPRPSPLDRPA
jgi:hypothetical protein